MPTHSKRLILVVAATTACAAGQNTAGTATGAALGDGSPTRGGSAGGALGDAGPTWDWSGIVGTGQSLSVGEKAPTTINATQRFGNLKLSLGASLDSMDGPPYDSDDPALSIAPLVEPIRAIGGWVGYPQNIKGETPDTAMANQISALCQRNIGEACTTVHTVVGESGQGMQVIDKTARSWGTAHSAHAYQATLFEARAIERLARAQAKTYGVGAIILTHGESDWADAAYGAAVYQLYRDYNEDLAAITRQKTRIPLLLTQQHAYPHNDNEHPPASTLAQEQVCRDHPGEVICAGPKYQYVYAPDHLHLTASQYDRLGEKYAEVYYEQVVLRHEWRPLEAIAATRHGRVISVQFHVPFAPLTWDEDVPAPHQGAVHSAWKNGRGFEVVNDAGEQTIESVTIQGDSVFIALVNEPDPAGLLVRYAMVQDGVSSNPAVAFGGTADGRIGQLSDSDPFVPYDTQTILCQVVKGSTTVTATTGFAAREVRDLVVGSSLPANTAVVSISGTTAALSRPWTGSTGTAPLAFATNQRNFAMSFEMSAP